MKKTKPPIKNQVPDTAIDLSKAYVLTGNTLEVKPTETSFNEKENHHPIIEKNFISKKQFLEIILENGKLLFGTNILLIDTKVKIDIEFSGNYIPDAILFDFNEQEKPKCYFIETMLSKQDFFGYQVPRMTNFFAQLKNAELQLSFVECMCKLINKNFHLKKKIKSFISSEEDVMDFVKRMLLNKISILFITDNAIVELPEMIQVYDNTWGKFIKPFVLKKFSIHRETFCILNPDYVDLDKATVKEKVKILKSTEDDHLKDVSDVVRAVYNSIKTELQKADTHIEFNPKQYYISIRKNKNLAFMSIGRKRISLVVVHPEKETRKEIKHHEIKTLTEKVQKFWNGPSCTVVIENPDNIKEVIALLKKLVAKS